MAALVAPLLAACVSSDPPGAKVPAARHPTPVTRVKGPVSANGTASTKGPICFGADLDYVFISVWIGRQGVPSGQLQSSTQDHRPPLA